MPTWKFDRGENALFEGTMLISTMQGGENQTYDLTGATLVLHFGPAIGSTHRTWNSGGSSLQIMGGTSGIWRFEFWPTDTESLTPGYYYYDLWLRTAALKEYCAVVGTVNLTPNIGTI